MESHFCNSEDISNPVGETLRIFELHCVYIKHVWNIFGHDYITFLLRPKIDCSLVVCFECSLAVTFSRVGKTGPGILQDRLKRRIRTLVGKIVGRGYIGYPQGNWAKVI